MKKTMEQQHPAADGLLEEFRHALELEEKSPATVRKYLHDVQVFLRYLDGEETVCKEKLIAYKEWLMGRYAVTSANSMLTAANRFLRFAGAADCCVKLFRLQYHTFCDNRAELSRAEYGRMLRAAEERGNRRLYFILQTLCATGIRIGELSSITVEALRQGTAVACNKGKSRAILLPKGLCGLLLAYAREQRIASGPVFVTRGGRPVDRSNVWREMQSLCKRAQIPPQKGYPHSLRHLFARTFYEKEKDIMHLADILGHHNVNTTRIYVLSDGEVHRAQIEDLDLFVVKK